MGKTCKKCGDHFPFKVVIDGKTRNLQKREFCLTCSPFGKHNTKDITCKKRSNSENVIRHRRRLKQKLVDYKGGKCERCGYDKPVPGAYDFHHRDPTQKSFGIASNLCKSLKVLLSEVDKCDLLCCRCHAEVHFELQSET